MYLEHRGMLFIKLLWVLVPVNSKPSPISTLQHVGNISHGGLSASGFGSNFSPRMDFEQWKPLTGRGDPLRNDPTYDYEPPVLERVHYWADEARPEHEHYPERKSEVLVLGVSSRKPSVAPRQPPISPKRQHRPSPLKYEDYTYKYSEYYPMTILVPPPPPPRGHQPSLFINPEEKLTVPMSSPKQPMLMNIPTTIAPEHLSSFAVQEANLIYQSSTTSQNWFLGINQTRFLPNSPVTSDYAGWGPTTPFDDNDIVNDTHNFILNDHSIKISKPYLFYKPFLSESPLPLITSGQQLVTAFVPTALPSIEPTISSTQPTWPPSDATYESTTESWNTNEETTPVYKTTNMIPTTVRLPFRPKPTVFDMLGPMMSMPLATNPDRPEDSLYAYASENIHVFKEHTTEDNRKLEDMHSMQPPLPVKIPESTKLSENQPFHVNPHILNNLLHVKPSDHTQDPYLHMRFTTPMTTSTTQASSSQESKFSTDVPTVPMYLIIQGHSKVKTYSSKGKNNLNDVSRNDITKQSVTNEVKHLHPLKERHTKKLEKLDTTRAGRAQDLKALIANGQGSIEIQETDMGIKYDVSDGSNVPIELYKKGIVDSDENNYKSQNKNMIQKRNKRKIERGNLLPFNEDAKVYVDEFLKDRKNETEFNKLLVQALNRDAIASIEKLENDDEDVKQHVNEDR